MKITRSQLKSIIKEELEAAQQGVSPKSEEQLLKKLENIQELIKTGNIAKLGAAFVELKKIEAAAARSEMVRNMVGDKIEELENKRKEAVRKWEQENIL
jgi:DNA mismatch repair protein MutH